MRSVFLNKLLIVHLLAATVAFLLPKTFGWGFQTPLGLSPVWQNVLHYVLNVGASMGWPFIVAMGLPVVICLSFDRWRRFQHGGRIFAAILVVMLGVALFCLAVIASSRWVAMNNFLARYFIPGYLLLMSMGGISAWRCCRQATLERAAGSTALFCAAVVLLLAAHVRLQTWGPSSKDIIGGGKGPEAWAVAAQYLAQRLDGIAGNYWDAWPSVFAAEQYRYDARLAGPEVIGITDRGDVLRGEFVARLAAQQEMKIGCIDLKVDACGTFIMTWSGVSGLRAQEFAPTERLPEDHTLTFVEVRPPVPEQVKNP